MTNKKCLILGGAGFIGSHIVDSLLTRGHKVRAFDRPRINTKNLSESWPDIEFIGGDVTNASDISKALKNIDTVVHLVSTTIPASSNDDPVYDVETNIAGTVRLLALAKDAGVRKIVFASSGGTVYGEPLQIPISETHPNNPICSYGIAKLAIEKYLHLFYHLYGLDYSILRIANPYGPRQDPHGGLGAVTVFLAKVIKGQQITIWGNGEVARDYFYVSDLVSAFIKVIELATSSKIYNIGGAKAYSLNEILAVIHRVTGKVPLVNYTAARKFDLPINYLDVSRAKAELEWEPETSLEKGIELTYNWFKSTEELN
jgi:UDP-glucose 4-epimerase